MARTKLDAKTPAELKKELTKALKTIDEQTAQLHCQNQIVEEMEKERMVHFGLIKKHKAMGRLFKRDLIEVSNQRSALMVSVVEMKNTNPVHAAQIADKVLSQCKPLTYYSNTELEDMINRTSPYDIDTVSPSTNKA